MPIVEVKLWEGRSHEQKAEMAKGITEVVSRAANVNPKVVTVIFTEVKKCNWSIEGVMTSEQKDPVK